MWAIEDSPGQKAAYRGGGIILLPAILLKTSPGGMTGGEKNVCRCAGEDATRKTKQGAINIIIIIYCYTTRVAHTHTHTHTHTVNSTKYKKHNNSTLRSKTRHSKSETTSYLSMDSVTLFSSFVIIIISAHITFSATRELHRIPPNPNQRRGKRQTGHRQHDIHHRVPTGCL